MKLTLEQQEVFIDLYQGYCDQLSVEAGDLVDLLFDADGDEFELDVVNGAILRYSLFTLLDMDLQREIELDDYERSISEEILRS